MVIIAGTFYVYYCDEQWGDIGCSCWGQLFLRAEHGLQQGTTRSSGSSRGALDDLKPCSVVVVVMPDDQLACAAKEQGSPIPKLLSGSSMAGV